MDQTFWVLHWWYSDGSGHGVVPQLIMADEKDLVEAVIKELDPGREYELVEVTLRAGCSI
ncbi:MAG: hypothetical protein GY826_11735 [Fuerstiella sp.]|jgi:hypothetical protein|nr:hypothetical protein [Fuerstiella sp.]